MGDFMLMLLVGFLGATLGAASIGAVTFMLFKRSIITPLPVYEAPKKKRHFIVPGEGGVYTLHEKRKCRVNDDETAWKTEQDSNLPRGN